MGTEKSMPALPFAVFDEFGKGADDRVMDHARQYAEQRVAEFAQSIIDEIPGGSIVDPQWVCDLLRKRSKQ